MKNLRTLLLVFICSFPVSGLFAQANSILWQQVFMNPNPGEIRIYSMCILADSSIVLVGEDNGNSDAGTAYKRSFLSRVTQNGTLIWRKNIPAPYPELARDVVALPDTSFCIIGSREYPYDFFAPRYSFNDVVYYHIDKEGNILRSKVWGGSNQDYGRSIIRGTDGSLIIGAESFKGNGMGDVPPGIGSSDIWVMKIDTAGTVLWSTIFGGSGKDQLYDMALKPDGGILLCGSTASNDGDFFGSHGNRDGFVMSLFATGNKQWAKLYGDNGDDDFEAIEILRDNSILIGGENYPTSFPTISNGIYLKLNSSGTQLWKNTFYSQCVTITDIHSLDDNGRFIVTGNNLLPSYNQALNYRGSFDGFFSVFDSAGAQLTTDYFGSTAYDRTNRGLPVQGKYFISAGFAGLSDGWVNGSDSIWGYRGYLVKNKIADFNRIKGYLYIDYNNNGIQEFEDNIYEQVPFTCIHYSDSVMNFSAGAYPNYEYEFRVDTGTYVVKPHLPAGYYTLATPEQQVVFNGHFKTENRYFRALPVPGYRDLSINLYPASVATPGFLSRYILTVSNIGTDTLKDIKVNLLIDTAKFTGSYAFMPEISSQHRDTASWIVPQVIPGGRQSMSAAFRIALPGTVDAGDTVIMTAFLTDSNYLTLENDTSFMQQLVVNAIDPNAKMEVHAGSINAKELYDNNYLQYSIYFQNTGTASAMNISVRDTLDERLDPTSFELLASSHPLRQEIKGRECLWGFDNIRLPDSNSNEPGSHGYIIYRLRAKPGVLHPGDTIKNSAAIYFDYNAPVYTNQERTVVKAVNGSCANAERYFNSTVTGVSYQWQIDSASGFIDINDNSFFGGSHGSRLHLKAVPTSWSGRKFRCIAITGNTRQYSSEYTLRFTSRFTGGHAANEWVEPANWECGLVPDRYTDVLIDSKAAISVQVNGNAVCKSLFVSNGVTVDVAQGYTITIYE